MMIRAYDEDYVASAQRILGDMMDFAMNTLEYDGDTFFHVYCVWHSTPVWEGKSFLCGGKDRVRAGKRSGTGKRFKGA